MKMATAMVAFSLYKDWLPSLDNLRNFLLMPTGEMFRAFQMVHEIGF
jgi:hypothetical protein